jgi:hypothetical protein
MFIHKGIVMDVSRPRRIRRSVINAHAREFVFQNEFEYSRMRNVCRRAARHPSIFI